MQNDKEAVDKVCEILCKLAEQFHDGFLNDPNERFSYEDLAGSMIIVRNRLREMAGANEVKNENA